MAERQLGSPCAAGAPRRPTFEPRRSDVQFDPSTPFDPSGLVSLDLFTGTLQLITLHRRTSGRVGNKGGEVERLDENEEFVSRSSRMEKAWGMGKRLEKGDCMSCLE